MTDEKNNANLAQKPGLMPILIVVIVVVAGIAGIFAYNEFLKPEPGSGFYGIVVDYGNGTILTDDSSFSNNTPLGVLQVFVGYENVVDEGGLVTSINGVATVDDVPELAGTEARYWLFYVNGEMPMESAAVYELQDGDLVEFKFETSPW